MAAFYLVNVSIPRPVPVTPTLPLPHSLLPVFIPRPQKKKEFWTSKKHPWSLDGDDDEMQSNNNKNTRTNLIITKTVGGPAATQRNSVLSRIQSTITSRDAQQRPSSGYTAAHSSSSMRSMQVGGMVSDRMETSGLFGHGGRTIASTTETLVQLNNLHWEVSEDDLQVCFVSRRSDSHAPIFSTRSQISYALPHICTLPRLRVSPDDQSNCPLNNPPPPPK